MINSMIFIINMGIHENHEIHESRMSKTYEIRNDSQPVFQKDGPFSKGRSKSCILPKFN